MTNSSVEAAVERFHFRLTADEKKLLREAAALNGTTLAGFVRRAALEDAKRLIEAANALEKLSDKTCATAAKETAH